MSALAEGEIRPETAGARPQVTVQTSAFVDDFGAMYYEVNDDATVFYFGLNDSNDDSIHVALTDQAVMNLARLVNQAVCAMLRTRGIPIPPWIGQEQSNRDPARHERHN
jgi:hypothetical protein